MSRLPRRNNIYIYVRQKVHGPQAGRVRMERQATHAGLLEGLNELDKTGRDAPGHLVTEPFFGLYERNQQFIFFFQPYFAAVGPG